MIAEMRQIKARRSAAHRLWPYDTYSGWLSMGQRGRLGLVF
jgi:hypothetical protein